MMVHNNNGARNILDFFALEPLHIKNACITIGNFDGVHKGHQAIIAKMVNQAQLSTKQVIVVTFFPNPSDFFNPNRNSFYLSTPQEKERLLLDMGVDQVITFKFDHDFANLSPEAFLSGLKEKLGLSVLVVGYDFALGKNRRGTIDVIKRISHELGFEVKMIEPLNQGDQAISSTLIRNRLDAGDMAAVREMLGRYYAVDGVVRHGSNRGAKMGLPTANIEHWPHKKLPAIGVYATHVYLRGQMYWGMTNVGYRPTFEDQEKPNIETFILNFEGNVVGERLTIEFIQKIREEQKFNGVDDFLAQIEKDKITAQRILNDAEI